MIATTTPCQLIERLHWPYATKQFDPKRNISARDWTALEEAHLTTAMSNELSTHAESLMDLSEHRGLRHDDLIDTASEQEASDSYKDRFIDLLSIFLPEEETADESALH